MQARYTILTGLISAPLVGLLMGLAANPTMTASPEPAWRQAKPDPIYSSPRQIVDAGPQDLSPSWGIDRMPTWKRRAAERQTAADDVRYVEYVPEPTAELAVVHSAPEPAPAEDAAAPQSPARDAQAPVTAEAAAQDDGAAPPAQAGT